MEKINTIKTISFATFFGDKYYSEKNVVVIHEDKMYTIKKIGESKDYLYITTSEEIQKDKL